MLAAAFSPGVVTQPCENRKNLAREWTFGIGKSSTKMRKNLDHFDIK